mmetsp:Transcript_146616/g.258357  ORF Transcript_146616/g.258357 Transcript_146616/m.258357 type:complete len:595 (-) Transcript_146616:90-1874(-)
MTAQTTLKDFGYEEIKVIGRGQYGLVHLVRHIKEQNYYVCKTVDLTCLSERERQTAKQEVELLRRLVHTNIVEYKESWFMGNAIVISMQYCEGGDLATYIKDTARRRARIREVQIMSWFVQILSALHYVHDEKILHRDLKASNLFLTEKNSIVKLGDFGISRVFSNTTDLAISVVGTPHYMSPEVCENKPYTFKSDVWSLGCVLYELCMLKHTFVADNLLGLVHRIVSGKYEAIPPMYSANLNSLIQRMLTKNSATRPSVRNLLDDRHVQSFLSSQARSRGPSPPPSATRDLNTSWRGGNAARGRGGNVSGSSASPSGKNSTHVNNAKPDIRRNGRRQPLSSKPSQKEVDRQGAKAYALPSSQAASKQTNEPQPRRSVRAPTEAWPSHEARSLDNQLKASSEEFLSGEEYYEDDFCSDDDDSDLSDWQPDSVRASTPEVGALSTVREELPSFSTIRAETTVRVSKPEVAAVESESDVAAGTAAATPPSPTHADMHEKDRVVLRNTTGGVSMVATGTKNTTRSTAGAQGPTSPVLAALGRSATGGAWLGRSHRIRSVASPPPSGQHGQLVASHSSSSLRQGRNGMFFPSPKARLS